MRRSSKALRRVLPAVGLVLLVAAAAWATEGHGGGHGGGWMPSYEKWMDLVWRTMNFAALLAILVAALRKPIANGLTRRRQAIIEQFEELEARRQEAEARYREYEGKLAGIEAEVQRILDAAVAQGEAEEERIIAEAERTAGDIKRQAEMAVQHELAEAKRQLLAEVADAAAKAAEELVRKNLQAEDQVRLVRDYLGKVAK